MHILGPYVLKILAILACSHQYNKATKSKSQIIRIKATKISVAFLLDQYQRF